MIRETSCGRRFRENWECLQFTRLEIEVGFLQYVRRIDPAAEPPIQTQADHLPQTLTIAIEQRSQRSLVTFGGSLEKVVDFG
jgi:hypothetical protein